MIAKPILIFMALSLVGVLLASFFLNLSGLTTLDLLSFSISDKISKMTSIGFIGFLIVLPFVGGLISATPKILKRSEAIKAILVGSIIGAVIGGIVFSNLAGFMWPGIFFLIGALLAIHLVYMKQKEIKEWVGPRLGFASVQRQMMLVALGLALWGMITIIPQQETFTQNFENSLLHMTLPVGEQSLSANDTLIESMIDLSITSRTQMLQEVMQTPEFEIIQVSPDTQDQEFVQSMLSLQQTIGSTTYKNQVRQQVQFNLEKNPISGEELMGTLKDRIPILQTLEEWLWLLFSLGIASLFLFLSGIILQPLGMFWGMIFQKTLGKISTAPPEKKQVEDSELKKALKKAVAQDQQTKKEPPIIEEADSQKPDKSPFETKSDGSQQDKPELFPPGTL